MLVASAFHIAQLVIGRLVLGVGVGFATQATPLYLSEMAPYNLRGALNILFQLAVTIGEWSLQGGVVQPTVMCVALRQSLLWLQLAVSQQADDTGEAAAAARLSGPHMATCTPARHGMVHGAAYTCKRSSQTGTLFHAGCAV